MRIVQINVVASLSTGRIAISLCRTAMQAGHRALMCHSIDIRIATCPATSSAARRKRFWTWP